MKYIKILLDTVFIVVSFVFLIIQFACTTSPLQKKSYSYVQPRDWNHELKTLNISANLISKYHDETNSGSCKLILNGIDSLSLKITGPFEILVGRLYANPDYFLFYDVFNNQILDGKPTAKNLKRATMVPLSFDEFIRLLRCELPSNPDEFILDDTYKPESGILFKNPTNKDYIEYALYSSENNKLIQYQRKLKTGKLILDLLYMDYENFDGFQLAKYIIFNFPEINTKLDLQINNYDINKDINKPLRFNIPEGIKVYHIE